MDIDAGSHREAAEKALEIHRDPNSTATVFSVLEFDSIEDVVCIDLEEPTCTN